MNANILKKIQFIIDKQKALCDVYGAGQYLTPDGVSDFYTVSFDINKPCNIVCIIYSDCYETYSDTYNLDNWDEVAECNESLRVIKRDLKHGIRNLEAFDVNKEDEKGESYLNAFSASVIS